MKNKLLTITLAALSIVLAGSCEKSDDITPDNGSTAKALPQDALPCEFSVSATKKVHFSKGNLYWNGHHFKFEENQSGFSNTGSILDPTHLNHFFWSKNASVATAEKYNESGESASDVFFTNATEETANKNFSVNFLSGKYRTLSKEEWEYLFKYRKNASNKYGYATVSGASLGNSNGVIILPDNFNDPNTNLCPEYRGKFVPGKAKGWEGNRYDESGWNAMESAGAVFLPAAGYRNDSKIFDKGTDGYYWSSSPDNTTYAYIIHFCDSRIYPFDRTSSRKCGASVRLVTDAN